MQDQVKIVGIDGLKNACEAISTDELRLGHQPERPHPRWSIWAGYLTVSGPTTPRPECRSSSAPTAARSRQQRRGLHLAARQLPVLAEFGVAESGALRRFRFLGVQSLVCGHPRTKDQDPNRWYRVWNSRSQEFRLKARSTHARTARGDQTIRRRDRAGKCRFRAHARRDPWADWGKRRRQEHPHEDPERRARPDSGEMLLRGEVVRFRSPADAKAAGIGMIYQELSLMPALYGGRERVPRRHPNRFGLVDWKRHPRRTAAAAGRLGIDIDVTERVNSSRWVTAAHRDRPRCHFAAPRSSSWTSRRRPFGARDRSGSSV